jgi:hypothetical protein
MIPPVSNVPMAPRWCQNLTGPEKVAVPRRLYNSGQFKPSALRRGTDLEPVLHPHRAERRQRDGAGVHDDRVVVVVVIGGGRAWQLHQEPIAKRRRRPTRCHWSAPTFNDVPESDPGFQYIEALVASGITAGCGGGNFCPDASITRRQMAVFLACDNSSGSQVTAELRRWTDAGVASCPIASLRRERRRAERGDGQYEHCEGRDPAGGGHGGLR